MGKICSAASIRKNFLLRGVFRPYTNPHPPELPADIPSYHDLPFFKNQVKISLRNCGFINPESIEEYIARGGYRPCTRPSPT